MIKKRIRAIFSKPHKIVILKSEFQQLAQDLQSLSTEDPLSDVVNFFNIISRWHDRGVKDLIEEFDKVNYGQYDEVVTNLKLLQGHFVNAGRDIYGWNRTIRGEIVTPDNLFLGSVYGLFTKPVSFWKQGKDEQRGGWGFSGMENLNAYDVVSRQAYDFMVLHIVPMVSILNIIDLEATALTY